MGNDVIPVTIMQISGH